MNVIQNINNSKNISINMKMILLVLLLMIPTVLATEPVIEVTVVLPSNVSITNMQVYFGSFVPPQEHKGNTLPDPIIENLNATSYNISIVPFDLIINGTSHKIPKGNVHYAVDTWSGGHWIDKHIGGWANETIYIPLSAYERVRIKFWIRADYTNHYGRYEAWWSINAESLHLYVDLRAPSRESDLMTLGFAICIPLACLTFFDLALESFGDLKMWLKIAVAMIILAALGLSAFSVLRF